MQHKLEQLAADYQIAEPYSDRLDEDYITGMVESFFALHCWQQRGRPLPRLIEKHLLRPSMNEARGLAREIAHSGLLSVFKDELQGNVCAGVLELTREEEERRRVKQDLVALDRLVIVARERGAGGGAGA